MRGYDPVFNLGEGRPRRDSTREVVFGRIDNNNWHAIMLSCMKTAGVMQPESEAGGENGP